MAMYKQNTLLKNSNGISVCRRRLLNTIGFIGIGAVTGALNGCAYKELKALDKKYTRNYQEKINQVMISQDEKYIVVLCDRYHYVINVELDLLDADLLKAIRSSVRNKMGMLFNRFSVSEDNDLRGTFFLALHDREGALVSEEEVRIATSELGFRESSNNDKNNAKGVVVHASRFYTIAGKRYDSGGFQLPETITKLNREYIINIEERLPLSEKDREQKAKLTPVAAAEEGAMIITGGFAVLLIVPLMIAMLADSIGRAVEPTQSHSSANQ